MFSIANNARPLLAHARHSGATAALSTVQIPRLLELNDLQNLPGAKRRSKRVGRGIGSGKGKTCGKGHKGTHQRGSTLPRGFEGGQTPLFRRLPKIGFNNKNHEVTFEPVNVGVIQEFVTMGKLVPKPDALITMKDLQDAGVVTKLANGIKLLGTGKEKFKTPIHLEVVRASKSAIEAVEQAGGTVTCVHFNELALRALMKPHRFEILPRRARPQPKFMDIYLDSSVRGYLSPEVQQRNLKLFGAVTSEEKLREAFEQRRNRQE